jgi:alpha-glucosidase (family GH31 glycosyl hydrolase)
VVVDTNLGGLEFQDANGATLLQTSSGRALRWDPVTDDGRRFQLRFKRATEEHFYGLGQAGPRLDRDGLTRRLWNSHYGYGPGSDFAVPFIISSRGYGLFFDNSWDAEVAIGRSDGSNLLAYTAEGGDLDCYFVYGPDPKTILAEYAALTGHPPLPPKWALGYIQSTRHFQSPAEIVELAATLREKRFPCDAIVFLSTYGSDMGINNGVGTLDFHPELWADSASLLRQLEERNLHVVWHEYPVLGPKSPLFEEAHERGYLVETSGPHTGTMFGEGQQFVDFTNSDAAEWWWRMHQPLLDAGIDGWWLDGGEGPPSDLVLHGGPGAAVHNTFDLNRQSAFHAGESSSRPGIRPWLLCRSGYAGMQRLGAATWSGDIGNTFDVLESQLALGLSTAMSGIPYWGTDIGGFFHTVPESAELFVRWFQFAALCPVFRSHGRGLGLRGWHEHLPWAHGAEVEAICRAFSELRYELFPYTYSLAWEAHTRGLPLMRPLILEFPDDPNVVDMTSEYLWGPSILVAPVTRGGARHWPVYLPRGTWYDFWTGARFDGGGCVEVDAPLEQMPLFIRGGAIVPRAAVHQHVGGANDRLIVDMYPEGESAFVVYEDDGQTRAYEQGGYTLTEVSCSASSNRVRVRFAQTAGQGYAGKPATRPLNLRIRLPAPPRGVDVRGAVVSDSVWSPDPHNYVEVNITSANEPLTIEVAL